MGNEKNFKITTIKSDVAFIDVLGAKETIINDADKSLNIIHQCYDYACNELAKIYEYILPVP